MGYIKTSNNQMVVWGQVTQDATFRHFDSGKSVCNFSLKYGRAESNGQGSKKGLFINVSAWGKTGEYASGLEKGDYVICAGTLERDDYRSKKKGEDIFLLNAEIVLVQPVPVYAEEAPEDGGSTEGDGLSEQDDGEGGQLPY